MNKKGNYERPELLVIEMEMAHVIATSPGDIDISDDTHEGGDSMSKGFWEENF